MRAVDRGIESTAEAWNTFERWIDACTAETGLQNEFNDGGRVYIFTRHLREYRDGRITGAIWYAPTGERVIFAGRYQIDGAGRVLQGPQILKECSTTSPA